MKNLKRKNLVLALLVLFALAISGTTYAYWASSVSVTNDTQSETITIGSGQAVTTTVSVGETGGTGVLVPAGRAISGQVEEVTFVYTVDWTEDLAGTLASGTPGTLTVSMSNLLVGGVADTNGLINVNLTEGPTDLTTTNYTLAVVLNDAGTYTVTVVITLDEPADASEYSDVAGKAITFDLTFAVAVN